jgi:hypothetical protein
MENITALIGAARQDIERKLGKSIVSDNNFLDLPDDKKRIKNKEK